MTTATVDVTNAMHTVTIRVKGLNRLRARLWIAGHLFTLAGLVAGCKVEIDMPEQMPGG